MAKKIKNLVLMILFSINLFFVSIPALADDEEETILSAATGDICTEWQIDSGMCNITLRGMILKILNWFLFFLGLVATGSCIYGGFMYVISAGNDQNIEKAKKLIIYAAIGIIIIMLSAVLINALIGISSSSGSDNP
jgi:hypothetical protein